MYITINRIIHQCGARLCCCSFAVAVKREDYPDWDEVVSNIERRYRLQSEFAKFSKFPVNLRKKRSFLPGHTITILPPITISNLLPCPLNFSIKVRCFFQ